MEKRVLVVGVLVLLVAGAFTFKDKLLGVTDQSLPVVDSHSPAAVQDPNTVLYTETGFSPQTLTVKVGTSVTFKRVGTTKDMWVGSDPHPLHTGYPAFDQKTVSESYSYTFKEAGTYPYHNHIIPADGGTVVVQ